jgi:tetratricopeptide (TPR) repeat protein
MRARNARPYRSFMNIHTPDRRWIIPIALFSIAAICFSLLPKPTSQTRSPYAYNLELNLPGTTDRRQILQREVELYQTKVQQDPQSGLNLAALADAYWKLGKATGEVSWYLLAEQTAQKSIAALPFENPGASLILAQVAQAKHDFASAKQIATTVLKIHPNNDEAKAILVTCNLAVGELQQAQTQTQQMVQQLPSLGTLTLQALVEEAQGKPEAMETFRLAIQMEEAGEVGGSALVRVLLGRHFYNRGNLEQATSLYQEALRILPRYPLALMHLAALETRRGNYTQADRYYDQVIAYSQQAANVYDHTVLRGKARLKKLQGQSDRELLQQAEKLLREDTNAGHANGAFGHRRELAQLLLDRNQNQDVKEALALMQDEVKIRQDAQTLAVLARAFTVNNQLPKARTTIATALKSGVQNAGIFLQAAEIEQKLGNSEKVNNYRSLAKKVDPSFDESAQLVLGLDTL